MLNRASGIASARATDRLIGDPKACNCHQAVEIQKRIAAALPFVVAAIGELDRIPSTTIVGDSGPDAATLALVNARKALSALESDE